MIGDFLTTAVKMLLLIYIVPFEFTFPASAEGVRFEAARENFPDHHAKRPNVAIFGENFISEHFWREPFNR